MTSTETSKKSNKTEKFITHNPGQKRWNRVQKSSKIGHKQKTLIF